MAAGIIDPTKVSVLLTNKTILHIISRNEFGENDLSTDTYLFAYLNSKTMMIGSLSQGWFSMLLRLIFNVRCLEVFM